MTELIWHTMEERHLLVDGKKYLCQFDYGKCKNHSILKWHNGTFWIQNGIVCLLTLPEKWAELPDD